MLLSPSFLDKSREKLALALESGVDDAMVPDAREVIHATVNSVLDARVQRIYRRI